MADYPFMQFYVNDWRSDPQLSMCSPATRGIWQDALCAMHLSDRCGEISGTVDQLARICRCLPTEMDAAIADLHTTKTADVTFCNGNVTLVCRRMKREFKERQATAARVRKHRNGGKTPENPPRKSKCNGRVTDTRASESEVRGQNTEPPTPMASPQAAAGEDEAGKDAAAAGVRKAEEAKVRAEEKMRREAEFHALSVRLGTIFRRRPSTSLSDKEHRALNKLFPLSEEDLLLIEQYYSPEMKFATGRDGRPEDYRRRDLVTLLNNWPGEVDRARRHVTGVAKVVVPAAPEWPDGFLAWQRESEYANAPWPDWSKVPGYARSEFEASRRWKGVAHV